MNRLLLVFLILISLSGYAQVDGNYNYSLGVKAYTMMQMPKILQQANTDDYTNAWLSGGIIKFNDNQMAFRISGNYYYKRDFSFSNQCENCEQAKGSLNDYAIKLGFEKNFNYSMIQPYFAADFGFRANNFRGNITPQSSTSAQQVYNASANKSGGTITPTLGIKVNLLKQMSLYAETSLEFYYSYERQETVRNDAANTRTFAKYNKFETLLNPISIGLQIHLVGKN